MRTAPPSTSQPPQPPKPPAPSSLQLETGPCTSEDPAQPKNKNKEHDEQGNNL